MKKALLAAGCIVFSVMSASKVMAADLDFSGLFVFGDSLSDTGNTFTASQGRFPVPTTTSGQPAYFQGRFSNNLIWVDYFGQQIGKQPVPFVPLQVNPSIGGQEGINFAFGGAQTGISSTFPGFEGDIPGVLGQVGLLKQNSPNSTLDPNAIYSIFGGANDYFDAVFSGNVNANTVTGVVGNLSNSISLLAQGNAKNFLVFNLPDIGETPFAKAQGTAATIALNGLIQQHNEQLASALGNLRTLNPELNIYSVDINKLFRDARENPGQFGFQNVTDACLEGNFLQASNVCDNPNSFLFFDDVHPSSRAHALIANTALASVKGGSKSIPEPSTELGILTLASLGAVRVLKRKNNKRLVCK
ncbi:MAG: SGNH/GDSL hydrolase family protein [Calothrix sp. C42_A2020_038]|nr:SGNH/GDSL hydrolase family protein [Calothrix sp. C42_A2020_038]